MRMYVTTSVFIQQNVIIVKLTHKIEQEEWLQQKQNLSFCLVCSSPPFTTYLYNESRNMDRDNRFFQLTARLSWTTYSGIFLIMKITQLRKFMDFLIPSSYLSKSPIYSSCGKGIETRNKHIITRPEVFCDHSISNQINLKVVHHSYYKAAVPNILSLHTSCKVWVCHLSIKYCSNCKNPSVK